MTQTINPRLYKIYHAHTGETLLDLCTIEEYQEYLIIHKIPYCNTIARHYDANNKLTNIID